MIEAVDDPRRFEGDVLALAAAASAPYASFAFGDPALAAAVDAYLFARDVAEFSPPAGRLFLVDGRPAGLVALLTGRELATRRLAGAVALTRSGLLEQRGPGDDDDVRAHVRLAGTALLKPAADDLYLSRIAVHDAARGRGVGSALLEYVLDEGRRRRCPRCVLEVAPERAAAAYALYERHGFRETDRRLVRHPGSGRQLEYAHMARAL